MIEFDLKSAIVILAFVAIALFIVVMAIVIGVSKGYPDED